MSVSILQMIPEIGFGGAEQMVLNLAQELRGRGTKVTILVLSPVADGVEALMDGFSVDNGSLILCNKRAGFDLRAIVTVRDAIRRTKPDVVHTHQHALRYLLAGGGGLAAVPAVVHTLHTLESAQSGVIAGLMHRVARMRGVRPVAVAASIAGAYEKRYGYRDIEIVHNGIDMRRFTSNADLGTAWREAHEIGGGEFVFASVGRLHPVKNHQLLLRAFRSVLDEHPQSRLVLVGGGPLRRELGDLAHALNMLPHVKFLGACFDVEHVLQGADAFVLSSKWEGHPLSLVEAMAVGLPVVAPRVGGIVDVIADGENGLLFDEGSQADLSDRMLKICRDPEFGSRLGVSAHASVFAECSVEAMVDRYLAIYRRAE